MVASVIMPKARSVVARRASVESVQVEDRWTVEASVEAESRRTVEAVTRAVLAGASLGAAAIHFSVVPEHLHEYTPFGLFFTGLAVLQVAWAAAVLVRPSRSVMSLGAVASGVTIALWVVSRLAGLPLGPDRWSPEPWGWNDIICAGLEVVVIAGAAVAVSVGRRRLQARTVVRSITVCLVVVIAATCTALSPLAVTEQDEARGMASRPPMAGMDHHRFGGGSGYGVPAHG